MAEQNCWDSGWLDRWPKPSAKEIKLNLLKEQQCASYRHIHECQREIVRMQQAIRREERVLRRIKEEIAELESCKEPGEDLLKLGM